MTDYVYFVKASNGLIKIGKCKNVRVRVHALRGMSPIDLRLVHVIYCNGNAAMFERHLHKIFESRHHHGEWYKLTERDMKRVVGMDEDNIYSNHFTSIKGRDCKFRPYRTRKI